MSARPRRDDGAVHGVLNRVGRAALLDGFLYLEVAERRDLTMEALLVAIVSSLTMTAGLAALRLLSLGWWLVGGVAWGLGILTAGASLATVAGRVLGGRARFDELLRALGYAMVPLGLGIVPLGGFVPGFLAGGTWATACAVVAVREVHRIPTGAAVAVVVAPVLLLVGAVPLVGLALSSP